MEDLDMLLEDLGRGRTTGSNARTKQARPLSSRVDLNELEDLMEDLAAPTTKQSPAPVTSNSYQPPPEPQPQPQLQSYHSQSQIQVQSQPSSSSYQQAQPIYVAPSQSNYPPPQPQPQVVHAQPVQQQSNGYEAEPRQSVVVDDLESLMASLNSTPSKANSRRASTRTPTQATMSSTLDVSPSPSPTLSPQPAPKQAARLSTDPSSSSSAYGTGYNTGYGNESSNSSYQNPTPYNAQVVSNGNSYNSYQPQPQPQPTQAYNQTQSFQPQPQHQPTQSYGGYNQPQSQPHQQFNNSYQPQSAYQPSYSSSPSPAYNPPRPSGPGASELDSLLDNLNSQLSGTAQDSPYSKGTCYTCKQAILGEVISAVGKTFHPEHFICGNCRNPLGTGLFFEQGGAPHCERCFQELFCPRCAHCDKPVMDRCITAMGKKWHVEHFICTQCLRPFENGNFFEKDGRPYCEFDFFNLFAPKCGGCGEPIKADSINALGVQWHPEHFACAYCRKSLTGGVFFEHGGKPYCETHYHMQQGSLCAGCGKPIAGRVVNALDKKWHPEHFVCAFCMNPLAGGSFLEKNHKAYCRECHHKLFGPS